MADKAIPLSYLPKLREQCDELYEKKDNVIANPLESGTQDLTSLQVDGTVYNVPATEIVFSTDAAPDAVEVAGFSVEGQNFKFPSGGGGGTDIEVITYADELPTATETSPDLIQTPDGTLYKKKAVESDSLTGTWLLNDTVNITAGYVFLFSFESNGESFYIFRINTIAGVKTIEYNATVVYDSSAGGWKNENNKTINITDDSTLTNKEAATQWLTSNATKQGGISVLYEYIAIPEVPTPTTADNGKVLGVVNGVYAFQEAGGATGYTVEFYEIAGGTVIYADGTTETISGSGTKNNVRMIVGLVANLNSWSIQKAVCLYNGQVQYGLSTTGDAQNIDLVIPVNNECFIQSFPD